MLCETPKITGRIYKISSPNTNNIYVGSTTKTLKDRLNKHTGNYTSYLNGKSLHISAYEVIKHGEPQIELIHEETFENKEDLLKLEGEYIQNLDNVVNRIVPGRSEEEKERLRKLTDIAYRERYKEEIKEKNKLYREREKETITERCKGYYQNNKEHIIEKATKWYEEHKEQKHVWGIQYRLTNADKIKERRAKEWECPVCLKTIRREEKARHERSKTHQQALNNQEVSPKVSL